MTALADILDTTALTAAVEDDVRVKIKYAEYVRLHRLVTGLTPRTVWEILATGGDLDALTASLPDAVHAWVTAVATRADRRGRRPGGRRGGRLPEGHRGPARRLDPAGLRGAGRA